MALSRQGVARPRWCVRQTFQCQLWNILCLALFYEPSSCCWLTTDSGSLTRSARSEYSLGYLFFCSKVFGARFRRVIYTGMLKCLGVRGERVWIFLRMKWNVIVSNGVCEFMKNWWFCRFWCYKDNFVSRSFSFPESGNLGSLFIF